MTYAATCQNCGSIAYVSDGECVTCGVNLVPGCATCRQPIDLAAGLCFRCGSAAGNHFILVEKPKTTA